MSATAGAAPVARIGELAPAEATAVLCLRLWCAGRRHDLARDFDARFGRDRGPMRLRSFEWFVELLLGAARRPIARHSVGCACVGGDERLIAALLTSAAEGDREEALQYAALIARPDTAPMLADLALQAGLSLRMLGAGPPTHAAPPTCH